MSLWNNGFWNLLMLFGSPKQGGKLERQLPNKTVGFQLTIPAKKKVKMLKITI